MRGSWRPNRTATYWPRLLWLQQRFFPVLLGCSTGAWGPNLSGCWFSLPHLISNSSDPQLTDFLSSPGLYNNLTSTLLPASVTISHSFNPSMVKVIISWYSSTGCTRYLHRWISYFDSLAGSEVNMQHSFSIFFTKMFGLVPEYIYIDHHHHQVILITHISLISFSIRPTHPAFFEGLLDCY